MVSLICLTENFLTGFNFGFCIFQTQKSKLRQFNLITYMTPEAHTIQAKQSGPRKYCINHLHRKSDLLQSPSSTFLKFQNCPIEMCTVVRPSSFHTIISFFWSTFKSGNYHHWQMQKLWDKMIKLAFWALRVSLLCIYIRSRSDKFSFLNVEQILSTQPQPNQTKDQITSYCGMLPFMLIIIAILVSFFFTVGYKCAVILFCLTEQCK